MVRHNWQYLSSWCTIAVNDRDVHNLACRWDAFWAGHPFASLCNGTAKRRKVLHASVPLRCHQQLLNPLRAFVLISSSKETVMALLTTGMRTCAARDDSIVLWTHSRSALYLQYAFECSSCIRQVHSSINKERKLYYRRKEGFMDWVIMIFRLRPAPYHNRLSFKPISEAPAK